ncbi:MAG: hypothetical protein IT561_02325 [Alphaproteobacteria bacterium]|nr:hypothetical protein [Alphaproteobacteria bacterium]
MAAVVAGTAGGLDEFFAATRAAFEDAARRLGRIERRYRLGPGVLRLSVAGAAMADAIAGALTHLRLPDDDGTASLTIRAWDGAGSGRPMVPAPWPATAYGQKGEIDVGGDGRYAGFFQQGAETLSLFDRPAAEAFYWARDAAAMPYWERSFPFRPIYHWAMAGTTLQPVHAGAVGRVHGGVLITGRSGAGKTTTTISCLEGGLAYAGDDYVLVDCGPAPTVYSLYDTAKFTEDSLARFPRFADAVWNRTRTGDDKALLYGHRAFPQALVAAMPIRAIVVPRVTGLPHTELRPIPVTAAIRALAPTTLAQLPGHGAETMAKLTRLCAAVPCLEVAAGTELAGIARALAAWLDR